MGKKDKSSKKKGLGAAKTAEKTAKKMKSKAMKNTGEVRYTNGSNRPNFLIVLGSANIVKFVINL